MVNALSIHFIHIVKKNCHFIGCLWQSIALFEDFLKKFDVAEEEKEGRELET